MKSNLNLKIVFLFSFVIWFLVFYFVITGWREHTLDTHLAAFPHFSEEERDQRIEEIEKSEKENLKALDLNPPLDDIFSDPLMIDYVSSAYGRSLDHQIHFFDDILPELVQKDESSGFLTRFFHIYGTQYSLETLRFAGFEGFASASSLNLFPHSDTDFLNRMGFAVAAWEAEGNRREGEWLDIFIQSPQYSAFLMEAFSEIDNLHDRSVESMVKEIRLLSIEQSLDPLEHLKNHFLCDAQELTEIQFQAFQEHRTKGDFVLASFDAEIIHNVWQHVEAAQHLSPLQYGNLHKSDSIFPNPFVDLAGVFAGALVASAVITDQYKRRKYLV